MSFGVILAVLYGISMIGAIVRWNQKSGLNGVLGWACAMPCAFSVISRDAVIKDMKEQNPDVFPVCEMKGCNKNAIGAIQEYKLCKKHFENWPKTPQEILKEHVEKTAEEVAKKEEEE